VLPSTDAPGTDMICVVCGGAATVTADPPRRTLARGPDPEDPSYAVIAVLPELELCGEHYRATLEDGLVIGWCDDLQCRRYGQVGESSSCGEAYGSLKR
jgi:hypothetical protein